MNGGLLVVYRNSEVSARRESTVFNSAMCFLTQSRVSWVTAEWRKAYKNDYFDQIPLTLHLQFRLEDVLNKTSLALLVCK